MQLLCVLMLCLSKGSEGHVTSGVSTLHGTLRQKSAQLLVVHGLVGLSTLPAQPLLQQSIVFAPPITKGSRWHYQHMVVPPAILPINAAGCCWQVRACSDLSALTANQQCVAVHMLPCACSTFNIGLASFAPPPPAPPPSSIMRLTCQTPCSWGCWCTLLLL